MHPEIFHSIYEELSEDNFSFIYQAKYQDIEISNKILELAEQNLSNAGNSSELGKNLRFLLVESFQNILSHSFRPEIIHRTNNFPEMLMVRNIGGNYFISTTNLIENLKVEPVKNWLKDLKKISGEDLKKLYHNALEKKESTEEGNMGLGLIEMARRTGQNIDFDFRGINYYLSLFYLQLKLNGESGIAGNESTPQLETARKLHIKLTSYNVLMVYKGDFSQESILPMMNMIESNLMISEKIDLRKKVFYILMEVLQNTSKHAKRINGKSEGIFLIGIKAEGYYINIGNFVDTVDLEDLKDKLEKLQSMDETALTKLYKKGLKKEVASHRGGAGLGLIDIARYSKGKFKFDFKPIDEETSFFSFHVMI